MNRIKIIIVDDNKTVAEMLKLFVEKNTGFKILDIATSSKEQLEMMDKYRPDVILTDIMRKGENISGLDIILNCEKENRNEKFILITASDKREILKNNEEMPRNIIGYIRKPFNWNELLTLLQRVDMIIDNCATALAQKYHNVPIINDDKYIYNKSNK